MFTMFTTFIALVNESLRYVVDHADYAPLLRHVAADNATIVSADVRARGQRALSRRAARVRRQEAKESANQTQ